MDDISLEEQKALFLDEIAELEAIVQTAPPDSRESIQSSRLLAMCYRLVAQITDDIVSRKRGRLRLKDDNTRHTNYAATERA